MKKALGINELVHRMTLTWASFRKEVFLAGDLVCHKQKGGEDEALRDDVVGEVHEEAPAAFSGRFHCHLAVLQLRILPTLTQLA